MDSNHVHRVMCSEIIRLHLQSRERRERELNVNLEEIWSSGALLQSDVPIRPFTSLWFVGGGHEFRGRAIARALFKGLGYFIEVRFHPSCVWSENKYRPDHLFNPVVLLSNRMFEFTPRPSINPPDGRLPATFTRRGALDSFQQALGQAF